MQDPLDDFSTCGEVSSARRGELRRPGDALPGRLGRSKRRPGQPRTAPESPRATQGRPRGLQGRPRGRQEPQEGSRRPPGGPETLQNVAKNMVFTRRRASSTFVAQQRSERLPEAPKKPPGALKRKPPGAAQRPQGGRPECLKGSLLPFRTFSARQGPPNGRNTRPSCGQSVCKPDSPVLRKPCANFCMWISTATDSRSRSINPCPGR